MCTAAGKRPYHADRIVRRVCRVCDYLQLGADCDVVAVRGDGLGVILLPRRMHRLLLLVQGLLQLTLQD